MQIQQLYSIYKEHLIVETDTRKLKPGALFFVLKGPSFNGNKFAQEALDLGAAFVIVDEESAVLNERCILVEDGLITLQQLANYHRRQLNIPVLAITGSNGKTTTKELITAVLSRKFRTCATLGNLNNHIGVPLTLLSIRPDSEFAVVEMGANHRYEIESYCSIAEPTHGLITNCGKAHIEGFGSEEGVRLAKGELYDFLRSIRGTIFRNDDLEYLREMSRGIETQITYGTGEVDFQGCAELDGMFLNVLLNDEGIERKIKTQLVGAYNFPNIMSAVAVGMTFGVPENEVISALESYQPDNSRSQFLRKGSNEIILDAYNANPTSMRAAIESFARSTHPNKRLWLGAMKEMGTESDAEHAALLSLVEQFPWAEVVLVGDEFSEVKGDHPWFSNSAQAAEFIQNNPPKDASILIKGSRGSKMEAMLEAL